MTANRVYPNKVPASTNVSKERDRPRGFTQIPNLVLLDSDLSMQARALYAVLLSYAWDGPTVWPGMETLEKRTGWGEHSIRKYRRELEDAGLVESKREGQGRTNIYHLKEWVAPEGHHPSSAGLETHRGAVLQAHRGAPEEYKGEKYELLRRGEQNSPPDITGSLPAGAGRSPEGATPSPSEPNPGAGPSAKELNAVVFAGAKRQGFPLDDSQMGQLGKNWNRLIEQGTPGEELWRAAYRLVSDWPSGLRSPGKALERVRGESAGSSRGDAHLPYVPPKPTPAPAKEALKRHRRLRRYAPYAEEFDFTGDYNPPMRILMGLGGTPEERTENLERITRVARRAAMEAD